MCPSSHDFQGSGRSSQAHLLCNPLFLSVSTKPMAQEDYEAASRLRILISEPIDTPSAALILKLLNSWRKLVAAQVRKFSHSNCKRLLYFFLDLLWHVLKFHLSPDVGRSRPGERCCCILSYIDREVRGSKCQNPPTSLLWAWLSQGQRAGKERERNGCNLWLESRNSEGAFENRESFPLLLSCCQVHFFEFTESATPFMAWVCLKFALSEQMYSISLSWLAGSYPWLALYPSGRYPI